MEFCFSNHWNWLQWRYVTAAGVFFAKCFFLSMVSRLPCLQRSLCMHISQSVCAGLTSALLFSSSSIHVWCVRREARNRIVHSLMFGAYSFVLQLNMQIYPPNNDRPPPTKLQQRLIKKLGENAYPFQFEVKFTSRICMTLVRLWCLSCILGFLYFHDINQ